MAHTFTNLLSHIVFSTKNREPWLTAEIKPRLFSYLGGIFREMECKALLVNGPADHVHIAASLPARMAMSDIVRTVKAKSSGWVHETFPTAAGFAWQTGYGAFSVSQSQLEAVLAYVTKQEEHHQRVTFQEEYVSFLKKHNIQYDERFLWE